MDEDKYICSPSLTDIITLKLLCILHFKGDGYCLHNFYYQRSECDVLYIRKRGFATEYEIKVSRSDFKNDANKVVGKEKKIDIIKSGQRFNRFIYVTPIGLIKDNEIPDYAGLMEWDGNEMIIKKNAPLLHKRKYNIHDISEVMFDKLYYSYTNNEISKYSGICHQLQKNIKKEN